MTTFRVRVDQCRFTLQGLSGAHLYPDPDQPTDRGPIIVSRLDDGAWFVHNGRHRVIRARLNRLDEVDAITLTDHHAQVDAMNEAIVAALPDPRRPHAEADRHHAVSLALLDDRVHALEARVATVERDAAEASFAGPQ